jgi:hypothetical protein
MQMYLYTTTCATNIISWKIAKAENIYSAGGLGFFWHVGTFLLFQFCFFHFEKLADPTPFIFNYSATVCDSPDEYIVDDNFLFEFLTSGCCKNCQISVFYLMQKETWMN